MDRLRTVLALDSHNIGELRGIEDGRHAGHQALAKGRVTGEDVCKSLLLDVLCQQRRKVLRQTLDNVSGGLPPILQWTNLVVCSVVHIDDLLDTLDLGNLLRHGFHSLSGDEGGNWSSQLLRRGHGRQ
jgi:hypothetical protein